MAVQKMNQIKQHKETQKRLRNYQLADTDEITPKSPPVLDLPKEPKLSEKHSSVIEKSLRVSVVSSSNQSRRLKTFTRQWSPVKYKWPKNQAKGFLKLKYQK